MGAFKGPTKVHIRHRRRFDSSSLTLSASKLHAEQLEEAVPSRGGGAKAKLGRKIVTAIEKIDAAQKHYTASTTNWRITSVPLVRM